MWLFFLFLCILSVGNCQNCRGEERVRECENVCDKDGNCKIRAALLLPKNSAYVANLFTVGTVIELAMQHQAVKEAFPAGLSFEWTTYDVTDCDAAYAVISAIDAYNDCAHVFFGPACDFALAAVGRIAKFLGSTGTPIITTGGYSFDFAKPKQTCQDEFYMTVRSGPLGFKDVAYFLIDIMRHYNWRQLLLITEPEAQVHIAGKSTCHLMMKTFANYLKKENITYIPWDTTSDGGKNNTENLKIYLNYRYGWTRTALLYDTPAYDEYVGGSGGYLLASNIHSYMIMEGFTVVGKELIPEESHEDMLLQDVGNAFASEFGLTCVCVVFYFCNVYLISC